ncbi:hypothetical protein [uncultured Methanobacterium sp.]|uniref:hypothetical protein n=1 Tax=uncultured Methanobacterium sp. TaxID=176306 RepID=UPI000B234197|nr:hypothetical protein [uncultured Methanobacterium sp.]
MQLVTCLTRLLNGKLKLENNQETQFTTTFKELEVKRIVLVLILCLCSVLIIHLD